jgi:hypothetical protein
LELPFFVIEFEVKKMMVPNNFDIWQQVLGFLKDINIMEMVILIYFSGVSRILLEKLKVI